MSDIEKLRGVALFRNLSDSMLAEFAGYFTPRSCAAGEVIFKEKTTGDSLYIIVSGEVVIEKALDEEGREFKPLAILCAGDFFGEMAVIEGQVRFAQARAQRDSAVYEVGRDRFFDFIKQRPETGVTIFTEIMRTVLRRLQHTSSELTMLYDLSRMLMAQHKSPAEFFSALLEETRIHFGGAWNIRGYAYNMFNEEYEEVYARDVFQREGWPEPLPARPEPGWRGENAYVMTCAEGSRRLACAVFERQEKLSLGERNNLATIFNTISSIAGSAMINIEHQAEAAMREKLRKSKNTI